ncbi:MAG: undecaprenyl-diphosphate phosphatase [Candidatus Andersenbacteria bacterium]
MELLDIVILGVIQGLTEFLPISSKGHLLAARLLFGIDDSGGLAFDAFLHLGTLAAVLLYYRRVWWGMMRGLVVRDTEGRDKRELLAKLLVATVPAAAVGYWFEDVIAVSLRNEHFLSLGFLFTALALWLFDDHSPGSTLTRPRASFKDALFIGAAQVLALLPGVSRSGMTMAAGRARGLTRTQAATFSFLLSAPIIAGAGLASLSKLTHLVDFTPLQLAIGFGVSFLSGLAAIFMLLKIVERYSFKPFVGYLVIIALVVIYASS